MNLIPIFSHPASASSPQCSATPHSTPIEVFDMANRVRITYQWPDLAALTVRVVADSAYPDALDQARATARRALIDGLKDIAEVSDEDVD